MKLGPEQRATVRAARIAQARADRRSWRFWTYLLVIPVAAVLAGYPICILLFWSASFAPNGWFAWVFASLCLFATGSFVRLNTRRARQMRDAWLAGRNAPSSLGPTAGCTIALWMTMWSAIAATYVSNFGAASSEIGPRFASAMLRLLLHRQV